MALETKIAKAVPDSRRNFQAPVENAPQIEDQDTPIEDRNTPPTEDQNTPPMKDKTPAQPELVTLSSGSGSESPESRPVKKTLIVSIQNNAPTISRKIPPKKRNAKSPPGKAKSPPGKDKSPPAQPKKVQVGSLPEKTVPKLTNPSVIAKISKDLRSNNWSTLNL